MGKVAPTKTNKNNTKQTDKPGRGAWTNKLDPAMFGLPGTSSLTTLGGVGQLGAVARLRVVPKVHNVCRKADRQKREDKGRKEKSREDEMP